MVPSGGDNGGRWSAVRADFMPGSLVKTVATGVVLALVNALLAIALMSLIFRGDLADALPLGIGLGLISSAVLGLVIALRSSFSGLYSGVQDASAAIIGLSAVSITGAVVASQELSTVLAMMAVTSLATGLVLLAMGHLGWGEIARFVPFPVIGGLLAGTGYLIITGALGVLDVTSLVDLGSADGVGLFWPALGLATAFIVAARRGWSSRSYLVFLVVAVGGFHLVIWLAGMEPGEALARGWMLGPFPEGGLWKGFSYSAFFDADWTAISAELPALVTVLLVVPLTLLLYISALEVEIGADVDMNRELQATGWANLAAGFVGGPPGYMYLADTVITSRLVGSRRGPAIVSPMVMIGVVALGGVILDVVPQFVIGGLLLYVGAEFAYEWLWASRRRMTDIDYALVWAILVVIAAIGFLPGVTAGLIAATVLFVFRYSKIDVVKHEVTVAEHQSNIERSLPEAEFLRDRGSSVLILQLQGFIFFGTASRILSRIKESFDEPIPPEQVVFDFRRVSGVDSSAVAVFERIALLAREKSVRIVFTDQSQAQTSQFEELVAAYPDTIGLHPDLDHGIAWCEDRLLEEGDVAGNERYDRLSDLPGGLGPYLVDRTFAEGEVLMRRGDPSPGIYLIRSGRATVLLDSDDGTTTRLRTLLSGTVLGEISLYRNETCTATVVAEDRVELLHLDPLRFEELCRDDPTVAAELHAFVARVLAGRVSHANQAIRALSD